MNLSEMGDTEYLRYAYNIALYHHERWDGRGYPSGLSGDRIPICAQAVSIADVFDALTAPRVYKQAYSCVQAVNMILNKECGQFSPKLLACFKNVVSQFTKLAQQYADGYSPKDDAIAMPLPGPNWQSGASSTQLYMARYQTILHYVNDTVLELDLDTGAYHIVYNPNPELDAVLPAAESFDAFNIMRHIRSHPDDGAIAEQIREFLEKGHFRREVHRKSFSLRIFIPALGDYKSYELIFLRVKSDNENQHLVFFILHRLEQPRTKAGLLPGELAYEAPALRGLVGNALRCRCDEELTVDAGAGSLTLLTGFAQSEIAEIFGGKLIRLVAEEDRDALEKAMRSTVENGIPVETEFRLLRRDKKPVWVIARSRACTEADGQEYIYHGLYDNSRAKAIEQELKARVERNQVIVEQSGGIVFEWNMETDTMYCSPKWAEHFGYAPISENYGRQMGLATHFHPDDLKAIRLALEELKTSNETTVRIDVRIANSEAKYLWSRITATPYLDQKGRVCRIIGNIHDIDELKRAELSLRERAERDSLTGLFNRESCQTLIGEYLAGREENSLAAMLILDLDNFKSINDNYGHLYGDSVLSQIGSKLRQMFRSQDIVGRIGGDEFLIFMQNIPDEELVYSRCDQILNTFRSFFGQCAPGVNASCSIGVAMVPAHGTLFNDLFRRADEALYLSKRQGKGVCVVYAPEKAAEMRLDGIPAPTRIDSDVQPGLADSSFVRYVVRRLYESNDIIKTIDELLAQVGRELKVSRVYIFENNDDNSCCSNTFEWCNRGISPEKDKLQNVSYISDIAGWPEVFNEQGVFYCTDVTTLPAHFRAILEPQGIKSMLQCAIMDNGVFRGYVGFDECSVHRLWTQDQINLLQFLSEALATFLLKKRVQDKLSEQVDDFRGILDRQDIWLYIIDPESCRLKYMNSKARLAAGSDSDQPCYKALRNRDSRCENCPAENIRREKNASAVIEDSCFGRRVQANASQVRWNGETACLIFCHEL